ncbi:Folliculin [Candida viswanathii]|uniref:Folliculin n=1 Tax=Candida viswanathii TaxID=5486 RepID=A0A367YIN6_9ASCO|nr:Folliculin [Candida viswanathii]
MANYIVCLAHFCELHGPTIIICTQITTKQFLQDNLLSSNSRLANCASCQLLLPNSSVNLTTPLKSSDDAEESTYTCVSTHYPASSKRYSALTKLVMKSLSVETTSELSKPMFYGDAINGYCINQIFKIEDVNARGGERKYSLMVVSDDEFELLNNWDILLIYLSEIINLIQKKVVDKNLKTEAELSYNGDGGATNGNVLDNERFLRRSLIKPKSLTELTDDDDIFVKFHLLATELLKDINK